MKFTGIAAMLAVVTAVTGAAIPNVNGALAEVHQVTGDVQGLLSKALGTKDEAQVNKLVSKLEDVEKALKQLSGGEEKRQVLDLGVGANVNVLKRDEGLLDSLSLDNIIKRDDEGITGDLLGGILKRDDAISGLAEQITPQVKQVVQNLNVEQVTGLLNVLHVNGLLTNVESVLSNLLNGGLLKGITGDLLGGILKRDDAISSLAGQLLPKLTSGGILPKDLSADQLTGLLKVLDVNNLLTGVEGLVQGLLGGLPLKGLTGNLL